MSLLGLFVVRAAYLFRLTSISFNKTYRRFIVAGTLDQSKPSIRELVTGVSPSLRGLAPSEHHQLTRIFLLFLLSSSTSPFPISSTSSRTSEGRLPAISLCTGSSGPSLICRSLTTYFHFSLYDPSMTFSPLSLLSSPANRARRSRRGSLWGATAGARFRPEPRRAELPLLLQPAAFSKQPTTTHYSPTTCPLLVSSRSMLSP